jgi:hypothetical protein
MLAALINEQILKLERSASRFLRQAPEPSHTETSHGHLHETRLTNKQVSRIRGKQSSKRLGANAINC